MTDPKIKPGPEVRAEIKKMLRLWEDRSQSPITVRDGITPATATMIDAFTSHVVALTRAVLLQVDKGLTITIAPQVRLSLECAMTSAWLIVTEGGDEALALAGIKNKRTAINELLQRMDGFDASLSQAESLIKDLADSESAEGRVFKIRCDAMEGGDELYSLFRLASGLAHAGILLSDHYAEADETQPYGIIQSRAAELPDPEVWVAIQGVMLLQCLTALNHVNTAFKRTKQLTALAKRFGVSDEVRRLKTAD